MGCFCLSFIARHVLLTLDWLASNNLKTSVDLFMWLAWLQFIFSCWIGYEKFRAVEVCLYTDVNQPRVIKDNVFRIFIFVKIFFIIIDFSQRAMRSYISHIVTAGFVYILGKINIVPYNHRLTTAQHSLYS